MNEPGVTREEEFVLRRLDEAFPLLPADQGHVGWYALTAVVLLLGVLYVVWRYRQDARTIRWYWAGLLAALRIGVYAILAVAFLLPAKQTWETAERSSRVLVVLDVSPSVTQVMDEVRSGGGPRPKTRAEKVLDFLSDESVGFLKRLQDKNPVFVYRFGSRVDEEPAAAAGWTRADWDAFAKYDFKPWLLRGLSAAGRDAVKKSAGWKGDEPGTADWAVAWGKLPEAEAVPAGLSPEDAEALKANRGKLDKRVDVARSIVQGTNVPDSLTAVVNREAGNMVQGIVVFTDGRSNLGSDSAYVELKDRAAKEKIPLFTVAVGEARENVNIVLTDLQAPDRAPPDEPFKVVVEADGTGLDKQEVDVKLGLYLPGRDPKRDTPDHEVTTKLVFQPGEPPHGQAEFVLDPEKLPEALTEESKKVGKRRQLKQGQWAAVARIPRDRREVFADPEHVSPPRPIQVLDKPLRVLLWASGPTREYQTLRTLLVRETMQNRAELSVFLQNEGGAAGNIVQDVPPERLLTRFPTRLDTTDKATDRPEDKFYNLNEYDLVIAFDPDWSELSEAQIGDLNSWVNNLGGGLIYVAGPIHTYQLARADEGGRLKPLLEILPVLPDDIILIKARPIPRTPRRLEVKPAPDFDVLKLDEDVADDPAAGWERFFTGKDKPVRGADDKAFLSPARGVYAFYPVKATKPGATTLLEYLDVTERGEADPKPYLVVTQPARGRSAFLGSGEMWRLRAVNLDYYDRFWVKLARHVSANRRSLQSYRGQVLMNKEYTSGAMIRVQARLLAPNSKPYPPDALNPKFKVQQFDPTGNKEREFGPFPLAVKKSAGEFDGYYQAQVLADPRQFPPGDRRFRVVLDVPDSPGDVLTSDFLVRRSDPELDNPRPDFVALEQMAGTLDAVSARVTEPDVLDKLKAGQPDEKKVRLAFRLSDPQRVGLIPACMRTDNRVDRNRGPVEDLWDRGPTLPTWAVGAGKPAEVSLLLLVAVGLLSAEWVGRKVLRLA